MPQNDGVFRPVKVIAPKGTIFNPNFPRACFSRFCQVQRVVDNTILALADQLPAAGDGRQLGRDPLLLVLGLRAGDAASTGCTSRSTRAPTAAATARTPWTPSTTSWPTRATTRSRSSTCASRCAATSTSCGPEPAAPGKWRGGIGIIRRNRFLVDGTYSCEGDRQYDPPRGIFGGWDGLVASTHKNPGTPQEEYLEAKVTGIEFKAGEYIEFREPNAGGYGDPLERDPAMVREDVLDDFTTIELARDAYGVIFVDERDLEIDAEATESRRAEIRASRNGGPRLARAAVQPRGGQAALEQPHVGGGKQAFGMV